MQEWKQIELSNLQRKLNRAKDRLLYWQSPAALERWGAGEVEAWVGVFNRVITECQEQMVECF